MSDYKQTATRVFIKAVNEMIESGMVADQAEIIKKLGWNKSSMSSVMNGNRDIPLDVYAKFSEVFKPQTIPTEIEKTSLEKSIENLTQNELRTTAIIERLVSLLEQQYNPPGPHNQDLTHTEDLRQKKTSTKAG